ncbi:MAG: hypothetical protein Q7J34_13530 [Bacteroidales bacterium]|nr:hypothetical protein [Bacteroidales bacterium]
MNRHLLALAVLMMYIVLPEQNSTLIIFPEQGEAFYLVINGLQQNQSPETNVKVSELNTLSYKVRIRFENTQMPDFERTILSNERGMEATYKIKKNNKGRYVLHFLNEVPIHQTSQPAASQ